MAIGSLYDRVWPADDDGKTYNHLTSECGDIEDLSEKLVEIAKKSMPYMMVMEEAERYLALYPLCY